MQRIGSLRASTRLDSKAPATHARGMDGELKEFEDPPELGETGSKADIVLRCGFS